MINGACIFSSKRAKTLLTADLNLYTYQLVYLLGIIQHFIWQYMSYPQYTNTHMLLIVYEGCFLLIAYQAPPRPSSTSTKDHLYQGPPLPRTTSTKDHLDQAPPLPRSISPTRQLITRNVALQNSAMKIFSLCWQAR